MSTQRAPDPFRLVHRRAAAVIWALARHLWAITRGTGFWIGRGWSPDSTEHATGRALDGIVSTQVGRMPTPAQKAVGDAVAAWCVRHADAIGLRHILWYGQIYRHRYKAWGPLPGRTKDSSISDWHYDHLHILLEHATGTIPAADLITLETITKEMHDMDPNELAEAILTFPMQANGKNQPIIQHFADMVVATHAQSTAVTTELQRDKAQHEAVMKRLDAIDKKVAQ